MRSSHTAVAPQKPRPAQSTKPRALQRWLWTAVTGSLGSAALLGSAAWPLQAIAQAAAAVVDGVQQFHIPAGPLGAALEQFARSAGINLSYDATLVANRHTAGVQGSMASPQALQHLLAGTGLSATAQAGGGFSLAPAPALAHAASAEALPEVVVSGKGYGSTTEDSGSYTTWSTSSSTRLNLTPQETPQAVTVITRQRMDDQKLDNIVEVLEATAGVVVQMSSYGQDGTNIYARGNRVRNFQIDGVPASSTMNPFLFNAVSFDRVEVVRGATGIMNGIGTPAATVNMIRKRPTAERKISLTGQTGSWDRYGAGVDASSALNEDQSLRARFVADYKHERAWVERYRQKEYTLYGIAEYDLGPDTLLTGGFNHLQKDSNSAIQGRPLFNNDGSMMPLGFHDNKSQTWRYYDQEASNVFGSVEHRFAPGWVGKAELSHARYSYDGLAGSIWAANDASGAGSRLYASHWNSKPEQNNLDAYVSGAFDLFGHTHEVIAGVTLSRFKASGPSFTRDPNYPLEINWYDWDNAPEPGFTQTGTSYTRERQNSAFVNARFSLSDATSVLLGGRQTNWRLRGGNSTGTSYEQKENSIFVPYVGVVHALNDTWSVYGSYTKIFRPQDYYVIEFNQEPAAAEEGISYEAGLKASLDEGRLNASFAVFESKLKNQAVWNADDYRYNIQGLTKTRGLEMELSGEIANNWQLSAGYAYSRSKDKDNQPLFSYLPRQSFKLFTTYRLPGDWSPLTVGGGLNWQNATTSGHASIYYRQGAISLVSLMARYEVDKHLTLALNLNNALNKHYFSSINNNYGTFAAPRNVVLSAKYNF